MRIRIQPTIIIADPDPQHCLKLSRVDPKRLGTGLTVHVLLTMSNYKNCGSGLSLSGSNHLLDHPLDQLEVEY